MATSSSPIQILVVDDERGIRDLLSFELGAKGYHVSTASNGQEALEILSKNKFQLVISDVKMPKLGGVEFLDAIKKIAPEIEVILATGFGTIETAVDAMKKGAFDFIQKPFNLVDMFSVVDRALSRSEIKTLVGLYESSRAIFSSEKMETLLTNIAELCRTTLRADDVFVFLCDEKKESVFVGMKRLDEIEKNIRTQACQEILRHSENWNHGVFISDHLSADPRLAGISEIDRIHSALFYPLLSSDKVVGVLNVNRTESPEAFIRADLVSAPIYASQMSQVLHNAQMHENLNQKVEHLHAALKKMEEAQQRLIHSDKLATLGQMVASVVHDLNNPLSGILMSTQILLENNGLSVDQKEDLEMVLNQSQHCSNVIQQLLQYGRKENYHEEKIEPSDLVANTIKLVRKDLEALDIQIQTIVPENLPAFWADRTQIQQVVLNLVINARQAMDNSDEKVLIISGTETEGWVEICVKDSGCGISSENLPKIFDPFFTTKPAGQGTGLGLSICRDIVQKNGGNIEVESRPGEGTIFKIHFPIQKEHSK